MKAIKILAVLALVMFVVEVLGDAATGFMRKGKIIRSKWKKESMNIEKKRVLCS